MTWLIIVLLILRTIALFFAIFTSIATLHGIVNGGLTTIAQLSMSRYGDEIVQPVFSWTFFWLLGQEQLYTLLLTLFS